MIMLLSFPFFRYMAYECFLRTHQGLAALILYASWRHLPANRLLSRLCIYVSLGSFTLTLFLQVLSFCYQNGAFTSRSHTWAYISLDRTNEDEDKSEGKGEDVKEAVMVRVVLPRPMKLDAGQYVHL